MKRILLIIGSLSILIGAILMYIGNQMAQGEFNGVAYVPGDYTNFIIGCVFLVVGVIIIALPYLWNLIKSRDRNDETPISRFNSGCIVELLRAFAIIAIVSGIIDIIYGISKSTPNIFEGVGIIISALIFYGLTYIIEAAILYIKNQRKT